MVDLLHGVTRPHRAIGAAGLAAARLALGLGQRQLEFIVALEAERFAKAKDRGLGHAALLCKRSDGHELRVSMMGKHIIRNFFFRLCQLFVAAGQFFDHIPLHFGAPPPCVPLKTLV